MNAGLRAGAGQLTQGLKSSVIATATPKAMIVFNSQHRRPGLLSSFFAHAA